MPYKDKEKQRQYQLRWINRRRQEWLDENGPCLKCGSRDNLQVDHVDRGLKVDHRVWSWREDRRLAELSKCQVLCEPCHVEKTIGELGYNKSLEEVHGTALGYQKCRCRCDSCRDWKRAASKRETRKQHRYNGEVAERSIATGC